MQGGEARPGVAVREGTPPLNIVIRFAAPISPPETMHTISPSPPSPVSAAAAVTIKGASTDARADWNVSLPTQSPGFPN